MNIDMNNVSRKDFLVKSALGLAGAAFMPGAARAESPDAVMQEMKNINEVYRLKNVWKPVLNTKAIR
jgi:hypothetical protein